MNPRVFRLLPLWLTVLLVTTSVLPGGAWATGEAKFLVNSTADADSAGDGVCTLREAITAAVGSYNYNECVNTGTGFGYNTIGFSTPGGPVIYLASALPPISSGFVIIDGSTPGGSVVIDGVNAYRPLTVGGSGNLTLRNLTVRRGSAISSGGGVFNGGTLHVYNCSFLNNVTTADGGAIENTSGGTLTVVNSTFSGNSANYGGGVENNSATATILNCTFSGNRALGHGSAVGTYQGGTAIPVTAIRNCILANSAGGEDCYRGDTAGTLAGGNNIIETTAPGVGSCAAITASTADPRLGVLRGAPAYFPLLPGSPALDSGNDAVCSASPVNGLSQNRMPRPQGAHCDRGATETGKTLTLISTGTQDGWIREATETSGAGGAQNVTATTLRLGDDASNRQYRSLLSFQTSGLPDNAVIVDVILRIKWQGLTGGDASFLGIVADLKKGYFGSSSSLSTTDFSAAPAKSYGPFMPLALAGWYSVDLSAGRAYVNKLSGSGGLTQVRLRFKLDDNNNAIADYLSFSSGNAATASRPQLIVEYRLP